MDKKNNNKGFTLIEILAAVTILAIISTVVVVSVVRYINKSRNSVYETMEKSICDAASNYVINENLETEVTEAGDEGITYEGKKLMADKYLEDLTDPRNKKKNCKASVNIKVLNSDDSEMGISEYAYNVKLKCSRYSSTVDFTQGCAVKNRTVENTPDDTDDDPIAPDTPDPVVPDNPEPEPSKPDVDKTLLYYIVAEESKGTDKNVNFSLMPSAADSGVYTMKSTNTWQYPVHYYRGIVDNNNVLFAGFCWKMVRTTDSGGVKIIYNGIPNKNGSCDNSGENSQIGTSDFGVDSYDHQLAYFGYMYGNNYEYSDSYGTTSVLFDDGYTYRGTNFYYGTSVTYSGGRYRLVNAVKKRWDDNYSNLVGLYTCYSSSTSCSTVYYIAGTNSISHSDVPLSGGVTDPDFYTITLGKSVTDNGNGTFSLVDPVTILRKDWYTTYNLYRNYYMCRDLTSTTCDNINIITFTWDEGIEYDNSFGFVYGNDVSWDGTKYTLIDKFKSTLWTSDRKTLAKKYHYTCLNMTGQCSDVYYIYDFSGHRIYYFILSKGKNIENAKDEMFSNNISSKVKQAVDAWYKTKMTKYTDKLEDTIWCNDRTLYLGALVGKDTDAGYSLSSYNYFSSYKRITTGSPSTICPNASRDGFTVSTLSGGNGKLTYPVGLLTADEILLAGGRYGYSNLCYLYTGKIWWSLSPSSFIGYGNGNHYFGAVYARLWNAYGPAGVRPAISLAYGARAISGDGTVNNPYIVE